MKPLICMPMGDPAGVGPEILLKSLCKNDFSDVCRVAVIGDKQWLTKTARHCELNVQFHAFGSGDISSSPGAINLIESSAPDIQTILPGVISAAAGAAAFQFIEQTVAVVQSQPYAAMNAAMTTTPINKESLRAAKVPFIGHTEILASLTNTSEPLTLFQVKNLRVFFLTRHLSLREACAAVTIDKVYKTALKACNTLKQLGVTNPHLAIAGLNPHCGEDGLFGDEEQQAIKPAALKAQKEGFHVTGPYPADSVFHQALTGRFDAVLSLYHDQGHIATKMVDFERTISITCGLPFLRTSVDHGTAYDIAGKNLASEVSMTEAILLAARYCSRIRN